MTRQQELIILAWLRANEIDLINGPTPKWLAFLQMKEKLGLKRVGFEAFCRVTLYALTRGDLKCWRGRSTNGHATPLMFDRNGNAMAAV